MEQCAHQACSCEVTNGGAFCSDVCAQAETDSETSCGCPNDDCSGHEELGAQMRRPA
jgi:hypothetical protein